jgi:hypothetical protein
MFVIYEAFLDGGALAALAAYQKIHDPDTTHLG